MNLTTNTVRPEIAVGGENSDVGPADAMFIAYVEVRFASKKLALRTTREMPKLRAKNAMEIVEVSPSVS